MEPSGMVGDEASRVEGLEGRDALGKAKRRREVVLPSDVSK